MAIILKDVLNKLENVKILNIYGENGLKNAVTWVHMVESAEIAGFITHGELSFMTGIALSESNKMIDVVKAVFEKNASGFIINLGPYIDSVPQEVVDFSNDNDFPVIAVPWSVNMANIMRFISFDITNQRLKEMELDVAVKNAILTPQSTEIYINQIKSKMIDVNSQVCCAVFNIENCTEIDVNKIIFTLKPSLAYNFKDVILLSVFSKPVLVLLNSSKQKATEILEFCKNEIERIYKKTAMFYVGKNQKGFENLHKSYKNAIKIVNLRQKESIIFYNDLGISKLLAEIDDKEIIKDFVRETLKPIVDYDNMHHSDLVMILQKYLDSDGSVKAVADELFLHRNTVNYKLSKISELLDCNLSNHKDRVKFAVAFSLMELFPDISCCDT